MPHYIIPQTLNPRDIIHLRGLERTQPEQVFKIKEVFATPDQKAYLLRTVTVDKDYVQNFFVLVARHPEGFIVKIDSGFQPYRTPAVRLALREISEMLSNRSLENGEKRENRQRE